MGLRCPRAVSDSQRRAGLLLPGLPGFGALPEEGAGIPSEWPARRQGAKEGRKKVSLYKRGDVWWYKFRFAGQMIRESSKSESRTIAKEARAVAPPPT